MNEPAPVDAAQTLPNPAETFADFVAALDYAALPCAVVARAKLNLLDAFGIGLAAVNFEFAQPIASAIASIAGPGDYPVIGLPLKLPRRDAAHVNGTLIHGLDFDDTHGAAVAHTSASAAPTMLAAGQATGADGRRALTAFVIASELAARIGGAARGGFHEKGFHPTGVVGAFGAALASGYLDGLGATQLRDAQGIVLSQAAGSLEFLSDGAWTKRNHPGWASFCGQTASAMAKHGFSGPKRPYDGRFGLYPLHTRDGREIDYAFLTSDLGRRWELLEIAFKPYPACHMTHAFADAVVALKRDHGLTSNDVEHVTAHVAAAEMPVICEPLATKLRPQNAYDAQFSVHYVIAATLLRDRFTLAELEDDAVFSPAILALCDRVSVEVDPASAYPEFFSGAVTVTTKNGRTLHHREQHNRGSAANPLSDDDIIAKYFANATRTVPQARAERLLECILRLEREPDLGRMLELLGPP